MLPSPEGAIRAVLPDREINTFLVRAANDAVGSNDALNPMSLYEIRDLLLDAEVTIYILPPPPFQLLWLLSPPLDDAYRYLGGRLIIRSIVSPP